MLTNWQTIILAAGKSSRMNSSKHKSLVTIQGKSLLSWAYDLSKQVNDSDPIVVLGFNADKIKRSSLNLQVSWITETDLGRGNAVSLLTGIGLVDPQIENLLVLYVDDAFNYSPDTITKLCLEHQEKNNVLTLLTFPAPLTPFGGLIRDSAGKIMDTVSYSDAVSRNLTHFDVLCGAMTINKAWFKNSFPELHPNYKGEKGLPELISVAYKKGQNISDIKLEDNHWQGINTKTELNRARYLINKKSK